MNKWPWPIPLIASNMATKPELVGHFAPEAPDFNLAVPDQIRVEVFLRHLKRMGGGQAAGQRHDAELHPVAIARRSHERHYAGQADTEGSVSDNDLAVGRAVDAISHSPFWDDTAFFILEDDAQTGADHVDAHRSIALVISKYAPHGKDGRAVCRQPLLFHGEHYPHDGDAAGSAADEQQRCVQLDDFDAVYGAGRSSPRIRADYSNRDNGLIYTANPKTAPGRGREHEDGLSPRGPGGYAEAERDSVEGRDGFEAGSGDADAEQGEAAQG